MNNANLTRKRITPRVSDIVENLTEEDYEIIFRHGWDRTQFAWLSADEAVRRALTAEALREEGIDWRIEVRDYTNTVCCYYG